MFRFMEFSGGSISRGSGSAGKNVTDPNACYQACSEMVMPFCYDGVNDMFEASKWDVNQFSKVIYIFWSFYNTNLLLCLKILCRKEL